MHVTLQNQDNAFQAILCVSREADISVILRLDDIEDLPNLLRLAEAYGTPAVRIFGFDFSPGPGWKRMDTPTWEYEFA